MKKELDSFNLKTPVSNLLPALDFEVDNLEFRNLTHFINTVTKITQRDVDACGISYEKALDELVKRTPTITVEKQESIRNLVRKNLHKRGLITGDVYEEFKYATDGVQVGIDVGRYAAGEPECVMIPAKQYIDFFHELFISVSYPHHISNEDVAANVAKLLATVEELERQHIFIKITLVFPAKDVAPGKHVFSSIPLFHHKEQKSAQLMSSVVNERLLRKFYFALLEAVYERDLNASYGQATKLEGVMNIGDRFNEIAFFQEVKNKVGA